MLSEGELKKAIVSKLTDIVAAVQQSGLGLVVFDVERHVKENISFRSGTIYLDERKMDLGIAWQIRNEPTLEQPIIAWIYDETEFSEKASPELIEGLNNILRKAGVLSE